METSDSLAQLTNLVPIKPASDQYTNMCNILFSSSVSCNVDLQYITPFMVFGHMCNKLSVTYSLLRRMLGLH